MRISIMTYLFRSALSRKSSLWSARNHRRPQLEKMESRLAPAVIVGHVFLDANGNGIRETTETGQGGVTVFADLNNDGKHNPGSPGTIGEPFTSTNNEGKYGLQIAPGTYNIREIPPAGFVQSTKMPDPLTVSPNVTTVPGPNFGNKLAQPPMPAGGVITGRVFVDADGDGVHGPNEVGQPGVIVFIDINNNGKFDPPNSGAVVDPATQSGPNGHYELKIGVDGEYQVLEVVPQGFTMTTPVPGKVAVANGAVVPGPLFGNKQLPPPPPQGGVIHGIVFVDVDGDAQQDANEVGQAGVRVFIDLNGDGKWSNVSGPITLMEPSVLSGNNGGYGFKVPIDGEFQILEVVPQGYTMTTPTPGKVAVAGGATVTGPAFGNQLLPPPPPQGGVVHGRVFIDADGDAVLDPNEVGQGGVIVFVDLNNNGKFDPSNQGTLGDLARITDPNGNYEFKLGVDGEYQILEVVPAGFTMTTPIPGKISVTGGASVSGPLFGNKAEPPPPVQGGVIRGVVFVDQNGNGLRENNEPGQSGVIVFLDLNGDGKLTPPSPSTPGEPATKTNQEGKYELKVGANGEYSVLEIVPNGFKQTTGPTGKIAVANGALVTAPPFGNQPNNVLTFGAATGRVFFDANNNGKLDNNEPGMPFVRVYDDANNNGKYDAGERTTFSGLGGRYVLVLPAGDHSLRQVVPTGFVQTVAPGNVVITGGQITFNQNFGNFKGNGGGGGLPVTGFSTGGNTGSTTPVWAPIANEEVLPTLNGIYVGTP
jgi:hypothetical protein